VPRIPGFCVLQEAERLWAGSTRRERSADLLQDLRFGWPMLVRTPGSSIVAVLCLTCAIGANAAVFSWIEGILFRSCAASSCSRCATPFFYVPRRQAFTAVSALHIRTRLGPSVNAPALLRETRALDANVTPTELITMREQVDRTTAPQRIAVTTILIRRPRAGARGGGLYAMMSATVAQSRRELALRAALGADASALLRHVLAHACSRWPAC
jgi:hypothetical protein